jgi:hypothetical protein
MDDEQEYLAHCWVSNVCPCCGNHFEPSSRVGSGSKEKGGFCSLECYAKYYQYELRERIKRFASRGTG